MLYLIFVVCGIILGVLISLTVFMNNMYNNIYELKNLSDVLIKEKEDIDNRISKVYDDMCDLEYELEHKK